MGDPMGLPKRSLSERALAAVSDHPVVPDLFKPVDSLCVTKSCKESLQFLAIIHLLFHFLISP